MSISPVARCTCGHLCGDHAGGCLVARGRGTCSCSAFELANSQPHLDTLALLRSSIEVQGYAPSVREMAIALGVSSPATVNARLGVLEAAGLIRRMGPRAIRLEEK